MSVTSTSILFGREQYYTRRFLALAVGIFVVTTAFLAAVMVEAIPFIWQLTYVPVLIAVGGAVVNAYLNDGLFVSALNTAGIAFAVILTHGIHIILSPSAWYPEGSWYLLLTVVLFAVGVAAFVVGAGTRRVVTFITGWTARY